jgi:hypothetical protein
MGRQAKKKRMNIIAFLVIFLSFSSAFFYNDSYAANQSCRDCKIKAAYVFNFLKFIEWPEEFSPENTINICNLDNELMLPYLRALSRKNIKNKKIIAYNIDSVNNAGACTVLLIGKQKKNELKDILMPINSKPILTISDIDGFASLGGIIGFVEKKGKIRFEINSMSTKKSHLKISSQLVELAVAIR